MIDMDKGNLNKLVTNYPVELTPEEVENLSQTLSSVRTAREDDKTYTGEGFVNVNNTNNVISLTNEANEKLNQPIPTKVSDLTDSASYQTVSGMDEYLTKTSASENLAPLSITDDIESLKNSSSDWNKVSAKLDVTSFSTVSGTFLTEIPDTYATKNDLNIASSTLTSIDNDLSGHIDYVSAHSISSLDDYYTKTQVDSTFALKTEIPTTVTQLTDSGNYYQKTETSSNTEITNALNTKVDNPSQQTGLLVYDGDISAWVSMPPDTTIVQGKGSITANYESDSTYTVSLLASAENALKKVVNKIDTTAVEQKYQTKDDMSNYLTTSVASTTYQPIGDYATTSDISDMATQTWVGQQGFYTKASADNDYAPKTITATVNTLTGASASWNEVSAKLDSSVASTTYQTKADMEGYLTKNEASTTYQPTGNYLVANDITGKLDKSIYSNASGKWENASNVVVTNSANWNAKVDQGVLDDYYEKTDTSSKTELSTEFAKYQVTGDYVTQSDISDMATKTWVGEQGFYTKASGDNDYAPKTITATVNTLTNASAGWNEVSSKLDVSVASTTYQTKEDMNDYLTKSDASTTYQPIGDYLVSDDITGKLDKSIYSNASGKWENTYNTVNQYSAEGTWLTAHQSLTNYYTKSETSGANELADEFTKYITSGNITAQDTDYVMTTTGWKVLTLPGGGMTQVIHDITLTGQGNDDSKLGVAWSALSGNTINSAKSAGSAESAYIASFYYDNEQADTFNIAESINSIYNNIITTSGISPDNGISGSYNSQAQKFELGLTQTAYNSITSVSSKLDTTAAEQNYLTKSTYEIDSATFLTKSSADNDYAPKSITATVNTLTAASAGWDDKVDKPTTSFVDKYLVLRTDNDGNVSGWYDFQDLSYSKTEALETFVATANIDTTTLSGDGKSVSTKLGVNTDVIATSDYVNSSFLPTSGGTVSGELVVSATTETFDSSYVKCVNNGNEGYSRFGVGSYGEAIINSVNGNNNVKVNVKYSSANNNELIQVQKDGTDIGFLIPAVTSTTTAGLTNDGILHIILES